MNGFSLPVVMFALSLGSALAVGGAFVTRQMAAGAKILSRSAGVDAAAAEWAARTATGDSHPGERSIGAPAQLATIDLPDATVNRWVVRIDSAAAWVVAEATTKRKPLQRRRLGVLLIRTDTVWFVNATPRFVDLP